MTEPIIKRDSLSKQVSEKLEDMIENGTYSIGERIPTEPELMEMFAVSRNTIREAIKSLTWSGVLEVKQGDGTYVRSTNSFNANMQKKYEESSLQDIKEARFCIEVTIVHLASLRRNENDLKKIKDALNKRNNLNTNIKENTKADLNFHMAIADACHNKILIDLYHSIASFLEEHINERNLESTYTTEEIDNLHNELFYHIENNDFESAILSVKSILNI